MNKKEKEMICWHDWRLLHAEEEEIVQSRRGNGVGSQIGFTRNTHSYSPTHALSFCQLSTLSSRAFSFYTFVRSSITIYTPFSLNLLLQSSSSSTSSLQSTNTSQFLNYLLSINRRFSLSLLVRYGTSVHHIQRLRRLPPRRSLLRRRLRSGLIAFSLAGSACRSCRICFRIRRDGRCVYCLVNARYFEALD